MEVNRVIYIYKLEHPPYSPNILPCDFDIILKIKEPIGGKRFATREDIVNDVRQQVTRSANGVADAETDGIQCLPLRWQSVVTVVGDYIQAL
ncbi:uncharacterized protein TNCV_1439881 [Trichonephila clavipes]|nr:uncharacterized protein TNCV_1439881 [Trichonephila clavipes]